MMERWDHEPELPTQLVQSTWVGNLFWFGTGVVLGIFAFIAFALWIDPVLYR